MARALARRAIGDRSAGLRAANKRAATKPESGIAAQSASLAITSGGGLPTADTAELTITFDGELPAGADFTPTGFTLYAANRVWAATPDSASKLVNTLTISFYCDDVIVGGGDLNAGTPIAYSTTDNKLSYDGSDSTNLAGVASISNLSVSLAGDAVPVVCKLEWNGHIADKWNQSVQYSKAITSETVGGFTLVATGLSIVVSNGGDVDNEIGSGIYYQWSSDPNIFSDTSVLSDRMAGDSGFDFPAFTFPLYIVGGALCKPVSAAYQAVPTSQVNITMSRNLSVVIDQNGSGFSGRYSNLSLTGDIEQINADGDTILRWSVTPAGANMGVSYVSNDGSNTNIIDDQSRPIPPWSNLAIS